MKSVLSSTLINKLWKGIFLFLFFTFSIAYNIEAQTVVQFTTPGNTVFYVPYGVTQITVECWGAGGAGGGATSNEQGSPGGGGGAYARKVLNVIPCSIHGLSIGSGGSGSTNNGENGGASIFGTNLVVAAGGAGGGRNNSGTPGAGGNASSCIGDVVFSGGRGGYASGGTSGGGGGGASTSGNGSNSTGITGGAGAAVGGGSGANGRTSDGGGSTGSIIGGGGSGGRKEDSNLFNFWSPDDENGGSGARGQIKVTYTINACNSMPSGGTAEITLSHGCSGTSFSVSSNCYSINSGITYQWQSSPNGANAWTNISGATNPNLYSASVSSTTYYRLAVTCTATGETAYSSVVYFQTVACPDYNMPNGAIINTCAGYFYDSGGSSGNYGNSENRTTTFCADSGHIRIDLTSFNLEESEDYLYVYDGPNTSSPLAYQLSGTGSGANMPPVIISTGQCITFSFISDGSTNTAGWRGVVSCTDDENTIARNYCEAAPHICNLNGYSGVTSSFYNSNKPGNMCSGCSLFGGSLENNSWVSFTATDDIAIFNVSITNCSDGDGVQMGVYSGVNCNNFSIISDADFTEGDVGDILQDNTTNTITIPSGSAPPLVPGQTYYIMIDGFAGDVCNYTIEAMSGIFTTDITPEDTVICLGESVTIEGIGGHNYIWSNGGTDSSITVSPLVSTTYTVTISGGNPLCPEDIVLSSYVNVLPAPTPIISGPTHVCAGDSVLLIVSGGTTYEWNTGQTNDSILVAPGAPTDFTVTASAGLACTGTTSHHLDISPGPSITHISITDDNCNTSTGEISFSYTDVTPPVTINWDTSPVSHDTIISNLPAGSYTLTISDSTSCEFTQTYQVINIAGPVISSSSVINATCNQSNGGVNIVINTTQNLTYQWSTTPPQTSQNLSGVPAGQYTVTITDENGCTATATYTIGNTSGPNISNFNLTHPTCGDNNGSIAITTTGGTQPITYEWNTTPPQTTATASNLPPGSYTVVATDGTGCTITGTYSLQDLASPEITQITKVDETCSASNGSASVIYSGGSAPVNIIWNTVPPQNTLSVHNLPAGTYTVTLRDANNCTATQTVDIVDFPSPIIAEFTSENEMCDGQNGWIQANYTEGTAPIEFEWNTNPVQNTQTAINLTSGDYSVTITDANGCSTVGFESIINHPTPENEFTNIYMDTCIVGIGKVSAFPSGGSGIYSYTWNTVPSQNSQSATSLYPGVYTVTINDGYCTITDTIEIIGIPGPDAAFVANPSLVTLKNPNVNFKDLTDSEIVGWDWFFGDGFHSNADNPTHIYQDAGEYEVTMIVIDANGCIDTAQTTLTVNIDFGIWIPNSFTPNEDGKNERFGPKAIGFIERGYSMKIYDRWGRLVFETNDFYTQWDGRDHFSNKQKDVISTYVYEIIILDNLNDRHRYFGKINLLY